MDQDTKEENVEGVIELWRSMIELKDYVCCLEEKRKALAGLINRVRDFSEHRPEKNLCALLIAKPGSGKTSLVRSLAKRLQLRFLDFNITQMVGRENIIDCFDTIVTTQAQDPRQSVLVFFDEINAPLGNANVYDMFLMPLEDRAYIRSGKKHIINPCVWIFASTAKPISDPSGENKAADFTSRLSFDAIDLTDCDELESVYRGVVMIQRAFPDVRYVSKKILRIFAKRSKESPRELDKLVRSLRDVKDGRVSSRNLPGSQEETRDTPTWIRIG
jgi:hypothetical protein